MEIDDIYKPKKRSRAEQIEGLKAKTKEKAEKLGSHFKKAQSGLNRAHGRVRSVGQRADRLARRLNAGSTAAERMLGDVNSLYVGGQWGWSPAYGQRRRRNRSCKHCNNHRARRKSKRRRQTDALSDMMSWYGG